MKDEVSIEDVGDLPIDSYDWVDTSIKKGLGGGSPHLSCASYKYLYDTLPMKLGVQLPFIDFQYSILWILNVAPTQLHPNSWVFVQAFEILCEGLGKLP
ncbi:hypothetical protein CR513_49988, partial [Mucuna pruriens]